MLTDSAGAWPCCLHAHALHARAGAVRCVPVCKLQAIAVHGRLCSNAYQWVAGCLLSLMVPALPLPTAWQTKNGLLRASWTLAEASMRMCAIMLCNLELALAEHGATAVMTMTVQILLHFLLTWLNRYGGHCLTRDALLPCNAHLSNQYLTCIAGGVRQGILTGSALSRDRKTVAIRQQACGTSRGMCACVDSFSPRAAKVVDTITCQGHATVFRLAFGLPLAW